MGRSITYILTGNPIPKQTARRGTGKRMFNAQSQECLVAGITLKTQHNNQPLLKGALKLHGTFFMPIPESLSKKKQQELIGQYHTNKPDTSNLTKFIEDVGNGIIYHDDALIAVINIKKVYDLNPRTEFTLEELE